MWLLGAMPVLGSSPGMQEGPPGSAWTGVVTAVEKSNPGMNVSVELQQQEGSCMYGDRSGRAGQVVVVRADSRLKKGARVTVWVTETPTGTRAQLDRPRCTTAPEERPASKP